MLKQYRYILYMFSICAIISCSKDDGLDPFAPENCDVLSTYTHEIDLVEEFGTSFDYTNILNNESKSFKYNEELSLFDIVDERILCTNISYAQSATLVYKDNDSDDQIRLHLNQFLSPDYIPSYFLRRVSGVFNGLIFEELQFIQNTDNMHFDENNRLIYHDRAGDFLFAFDDRQGNQWLKSGSSRGTSTFYCGIEDNSDDFRQTIESIKLNAIFENGSLNYTDGFVSSYSFFPESVYGYSNYEAIERQGKCAGTELEILETASESFEYVVSDVYRIFINLTTGFESVNSTAYYNIIDIRMQYQTDFVELYQLRFILNDIDLYEVQSYEDPFAEYIFHDEININNTDFSNVYEFENRGRQLFFNLEQGILSFEDHLDIQNYLKQD